MANVLKPKRSNVASAAPSLAQLVDGELAVNTADKKFYMRVGGVIVDMTPTATWNGGTVTSAADFTGGLTVNSNAVWHNGLTRFQADFNNATLANRAYFQGSAVNGATVVGAIPNGTATQADFRAYGGSDPANASFLSLIATG